MASTPAVGTPEYDALMAETGGAAANPGFDYAAHIAATSGANNPPEPASPPPAAPPPPDNSSGSPPAAPYVDPAPIPSPGYVDPSVAAQAPGYVDPSVAAQAPGYVDPALPAVPSPASGYVDPSLPAVPNPAPVGPEGQSGATQVPPVSSGTDKGGAPYVPLTPSPVPPPSSPPSNSIPLPAVGTAAYDALLLETGRSDLVGFNYAAHLEAKKGVELENFDKYLNAGSAEELFSLLGTTNLNELGSSASSSQIQSLVSKFYDDPTFQSFLDDEAAARPAPGPAPSGDTATGLNPDGSITAVPISAPVAPPPSSTARAPVPVPAFGTVAYKALLLETGRSDLLGFDYAAHLAAKASTSLSDFDTYLNAESGEALLQKFGALNVNELMSQASPAQVQQLIAKFATDPAFANFLDAETALELPSTGSAAYDALLKETERTSLEGFDYSAHVAALTKAQRVMTGAKLSDDVLAEKRVGSASNDVIVQEENKFAALLGGAGDDTIQASDAGSLLAGGEGNDRLVGGKGRDKAVVEASLEKLQVRKVGNEWTVTDTDGTEGTDTLDGVERILTLEGGIALDVAADEEAGQVALLLGAVFDQEESLDASYVRVGLDLLEQGVSTDELIGLAFDVLGVSSPSAIVDLLWTNIIGEAPTTEQAQPFVDLLNGQMTVAELTSFAMLTEPNQAQINFVGLQETGIVFA